VPDRIHELVPEASLIYLVRDPLERILAHYVHEVSSLGERRPLPEALGDLGDPLNPYLIGSSYASQVERYIETFPADRLLVVDSHELRRHRAAALREVFAFLGADPSFTSPGFDQELNVGSDKRAHSRRYARLRDSRLGDMWRRLPAAAREPVSALARRATAPAVERPALDAALRERLAARLRPEAERLRALTGQRFESWSV
jgi:hypothetical protein